jgi:hypothetical protein
MDEAVRTTASPAAIWVIVIVMSIMTMILVSAAAVADSWQARIVRRARGARLGPAIGDVFTHAGTLGADSAGTDMTSADAPQSGTADPSATGSETRAYGPAGESTAAEERGSREPVPAPRTEQAAGQQPSGQHQREAADPGGDAPTLPDLPPVAGRQAMPPPRSGDTDRAERSRSRTGTPEDDEAGER